MRLHDITAIHPDHQLLLDYFTARYPQNAPWQLDGREFTFQSTVGANQRTTYMTTTDTTYYNVELREAQNWHRTGRPRLR